MAKRSGKLPLKKAPCTFDQKTLSKIDTIQKLAPQGREKIQVYEAANPWGPWKTVYMSDTWGSYGSTQGLWYSIVPSSISGTIRHST